MARNVEVDGDVIVDLGVDSDGDGDVAIDALSLLKVVDASMERRGGELLERMGMLMKLYR
jgi:hypothetical protein